MAKQSLPEPVNGIMVVCTGNICRSPMVEGLLRKRLDEAGLQHITVSSSGTAGWENHPPMDPAVQASAEIGVDISGLRSCPIEQGMVESADLILTMGRNHIDYITEEFRPDSSKLRLLGDFHDQNPGMEIRDPYGTSVTNYRKILADIIRSVDGLVALLKDAEEQA